METAVCACCKEDVVPNPPRAIWKVVNVVFWAAVLLMGLIFGTLLGLNVVLVPVWCAMAGAVGVTAARASTWTCPECSAEMYPSKEMEAAIRAERKRGRRIDGHHGPRHLVPRHA